MSLPSHNVDKLNGRKVNEIDSLIDASGLGIVDTSQGDTSAYTTSARHTTDGCADGSPPLDDLYCYPITNNNWEDPLLHSDSSIEKTSDPPHDYRDTAADSPRCDEPDDVDKKGCCSTSSWLFCSLNRQEKLVLLSVAVVNMTSQMCLSVMAPFFPIEASHKGLSTTVSGWIFGIFPLVQFVVSPIIGKLLPIVGSRNAITFGQSFTGAVVACFGFIDRIENYDAFLALCLLLRILMAIGCSASETSSFAVVVNVFPAKAATVLGLLETAIGLGMMFGPAIGGVLYEAGGFQLPFLLLGGFMLISSILMYFCLPAKDESLHSRNDAISMSQLLRIPAVIVVCLSIFVASLVWSLFDPILEPHLEKFNVSPAIVGLLFLLVAACYAIASPILGALADRMSDCSPMLIVGFFSMAVTLLLMGPSPWLGFGDSDNYISLTIVTLIALGISESLTIVPTFNKILDAVEKTGIEFNFSLYGMVSGIWISCYALGDFAGPALGGWLADRDGFPTCLSYISAVCAAMGTIVLALWIWEKWSARRSETDVTIEEKSKEADKHATEQRSDKTITETGGSIALSPLLAKLDYDRDVIQLQKHTRVVQYSAPDCYPTTAPCKLS